MRVNALAPVVAVDLDGTSGDYHQHFIWFLKNIYLPGEYLRERWSNTFKGEFSAALDMDKALYREAKLAYRQGGLKRCMPQFESDRGELSEEIAYIRSLGIQVWVTTNRPWMRLDNIDPDTRYWIEGNMGTVDGIIFSQEKFHDLVDNVGSDRILGVFDDLPENIEEARRLGLRTVLRAGPHNAWWPPRNGVRVVTRFKDFSRAVEVWKEEWDERH